MNLKIVCTFLTILGCANCDTALWRQIRVKFSFSGILENYDSFWKVDNTLTEALKNGWMKVDSSNTLGLTTVCISQADVRMCPLYDGKGFIAGVQLAIPPSDVEGKGIPYDFNNFPVYEKKTINGVEYWSSTFYVINPTTTLSTGGRTSFTNLGDGLWFKNGTSYTEVPTSENDIAMNTPYTKQNCLPNMGIHYYYNSTKNSRCEDFQPFFLMTKWGNIDGLGWQFFGRTKFVTRDWYDKIGRQEATMTVPNAPPCLGNWAETYGVISIHFYFIDKPWDVECDQGRESIAPITGINWLILNALYIMGDIAACTRKLFMF